jgi:asparagine synthase (glutamine-hydrolysing)
MANEDGRFAMVFNGEIYNSPAAWAECERAGHQFRSSMDGEVILHLWELEGPSALERLNGIFAVAVLDSTTGELFLARDPLGAKPLVYAEADGELWFASELRALLAMGAPTLSPWRSSCLSSGSPIREPPMPATPGSLGVCARLGRSDLVVR